MLRSLWFHSTQFALGARNFTFDPRKWHHLGVSKRRRHIPEKGSLHFYWQFHSIFSWFRKAMFPRNTGSAFESHLHRIKTRLRAQTLRDARLFSVSIRKASETFVSGSDGGLCQADVTAPSISFPRRRQTTSQLPSCSYTKYFHQ